MNNSLINRNNNNFIKRKKLLSIALEKCKHLREALSCSSIFTYENNKCNSAEHFSDSLPSNRKKLLSIALEKCKHLREALSCSSIFTYENNKCNSAEHFSDSLPSNRLFHHSSPDLRSFIFEDDYNKRIGSEKGTPNQLPLQLKPKSNNLNLIKYILNNDSFDDSFESNTNHHHHAHYKTPTHFENAISTNCNNYDQDEDQRIGSMQNCAISKKGLTIGHRNSEYIKEDDKLIENLLYNKENIIHRNESSNTNNLFKQSNSIQLLKGDTINGQAMKDYCKNSSFGSACSLKAANLHFKCLRLCTKFVDNLMSRAVNFSKTTRNRGLRNPIKQPQKSCLTSVSPIWPFNKVISDDRNTSPNSMNMELEISVPMPSSSTAFSRVSGGTWTTTSFTLFTTELRNQIGITSTKQQQSDSLINFYCLTNHTINNSNHHNACIQVNLSHNKSNNVPHNHDIHHIRIRLFYVNNPTKQNEETTQWESELISVNFVDPDEIRSIILSKVHLNSSNSTTYLYIHLCSGQKVKTGDANVIGRLEFELEPIWDTSVATSSKNQTNKNTMEKSNCYHEHLESSRRPAKHHKLHSFKNPMCSNQDVMRTIAPSTNIILNTILHISEGKELRLSSNHHNKQLLTSKYVTKLQNDLIMIEHSYLIVRLPWCHQIHSTTLDQYHSNVAWLSGSCPQYAFTMRSQYLLNQESASRLIKSSVVLEIWSKWMSGLPDHLIGLVKIPTDQLVKLYAHFDSNTSQIWWHSNNVIQSLFQAHHPMVPVDTWLPIIDPFSGCENGQIHVLLAVGTQEQIDNFLTSQNLKCIINVNNNILDQDTRSNDAYKEMKDNSHVELLVEHRFGVTIEQLIDFDPHIPLKHDSNYDGAVPWGDLDCYVQYFFPADSKAKCLASYRTTAQMLNKPSIITDNTTIQEKLSKHISCEFISTNSPNKSQDASSLILYRPSSSSYWNHTHKLCRNVHITSELQNNMNLIQTKIETDFIQWILDMLTRADFEMNKLNLKRGLLIEIWLRIYSPNLHDCLAAKGYISEELLYQLINQNKSKISGNDDNEPNHHSLRFCIDLHDVNSSSRCVNGKLQISMDYCYNIISNQSLKFDNTILRSTIPFNKQTALFPPSPNQSLYSQILILPSQTHFNHRIQVCLDGVSGLKLSMITKNETFTSCLNTSFHARLHCLLLVPTHSNSSCSYYPHVIKSSISSPVYNLCYAIELNCKLDVQLPSSWLIAYQQHCQQPTVIKTSSINSNSTNNFEVTVLEAILNGDQYQMEQYIRPISKPCIMIQVDIWFQKNTSAKLVNEYTKEKIKYWGLQYDFDEQLSNENVASILNPGIEYQLMCSCRVPLSGLVFSSHGNLPLRWYPLTSFININEDGESVYDNSSISWQSRFSGAIHLSMRVIDPYMLRSVSYNTPTASNNNTLNSIHNSSMINCLRDWNISFNIEKLETGQTSVVAFNNECELWRDGLDEYACQYKRFTVYLNFAYLPKIKQLLDDTLDVNNALLKSYTTQNSFKAYAFVRFQFPNYGTQMSQLIYLPNDDVSDNYDHTTSNKYSNIVEFKEYKEFIIPVSGELRCFLAESALELQVWIIWTDENSKEFDRSQQETGLHKLIIDELGNKEYSKRHQVPAPRHIGTAIVPLYHLLYPRPQTISTHSNNNTAQSLDGDPSGIRWWNSQPQWMVRDRNSIIGLPVYPLYRANTTNFYDSWIAVQIEMTGSKTENCLSSRRYHTCKMNKLITPEVDGHLGWNLKNYPTPLINNPLQNNNNNINSSCQLTNGLYTTDLFTAEHKKNKTFPAEIMIEKAYHLCLSHHNKFGNSTESSERSEPYFKTNDDDNNNNDNKESDYYVFVTFSVDGHQCLSNKNYSITGANDSITNQDELLRKQIIKSLSNNNHNSNTTTTNGRIAVTPKVKNLKYAHWNYCRFIRIPLEFIQPSCNQGLMFYVWAIKDNELNNCKQHTPKLIGIATVDLTTLSHLFTNPTYSSTNNEFNQIYGWYHILNNDTGCPSGQILIGVKPLINIGQQMNYCSTLKNSEFNSVSHDVYNDQVKPFSNYSIFQQDFNHTSLLNNDLMKSTHSLIDCNTVKTSNDLIMNKEESNHSELNRSVLFENLRTRLSELDEMNNKLKNRLNLSNSNEKFFSHADYNSTINNNSNNNNNNNNNNVDVNDENVENKKTFLNQSSEIALQSLNDENHLMNLVNESPHHRLLDLHINDKDINVISNCKYTDLVLQSQSLNSNNDDGNVDNNNDYTMIKSNNVIISGYYSLKDSINGNSEYHFNSNSLQNYTINKTLNIIETLSNTNHEINEMQNVLLDDNQSDSADANKDDERSDISIVSPLLLDQSSDISNDNDVQNDDNDVISIETDVEHSTSFDEFTKEVNNNNNKQPEDDFKGPNMNILHYDENNSNKLSQIGEGNDCSSLHAKLRSKINNQISTELPDQETASETAASSVWLPDDDVDVLHEDNVYSLSATQSTITQSPPSLDNQSIKQAELSLTNSHILQNTHISESILAYDDEHINNRIVRPEVCESNKVKGNKNMEADEEGNGADKKYRLENDSVELFDGIKLNNDDDFAETSRWSDDVEPQQKSSTNSKPVMTIPNFFPETSCIEAILTGRTNDCHQEDKSSMDSNTDLLDNKNIDPLRDRLNKRLSEAVYHTITTSMNNTTQIRNNNTDIIINDTLSALITNGYKTRGLKKAERIFSMTMK
ncbi:hypothetical protein MN116_007868 [Schistosoma mekongi]|uniref:C2 domain-containing protein n=1 Tax=Schistosoma mekongi TaxID=38744 RepID=A0AAE2D2C6_SCHME|nr:hypothetical protein MN116_007868 [Schistosoma mekongi]